MLTGLDKIRRRPRVLGRTIREHRLALAAFLTPLAIRAIPGVIVGPYPVGFDTMAFYVPRGLIPGLFLVWVAVER